MEKPKILLVEDDNTLAQTIKRVLKNEFDIHTVQTAKDAIRLISKNRYDAYLIDIKLPDRGGIDGLDISRTIRKTDKKTPIIIVTGKTAINYKLGAFNIGADDYLCKPFNYLELSARIKAVLKRRKLQNNNLLEIKDLRLEKDTHKVIRSGKEFELRKKEFQILEYLLKNKGRVLSRERIQQSIWERDVRSNTIEVHIKNLREKIDDPFENKLIKTIYGIGYKIE